MSKSRRSQLKKDEILSILQDVNTRKKCRYTSKYIDQCNNHPCNDLGYCKEHSDSIQAKLQKKGYEKRETTKQHIKLKRNKYGRRVEPYNNIVFDGHLNLKMDH